MLGVCRHRRRSPHDPPPAAVSGLHFAPRGMSLVRESVRMVLQKLIETEATQTIGAARYERTLPARLNSPAAMTGAELVSSAQPAGLVAALTSVSQARHTLPRALHPQRPRARAPGRD